MDIITSHINADFDSLASMVAAKKLYPGAQIVFPGSQEKKLRDFMEAFHPVDIKRIKDIDLSKVIRLIMVDTKNPGRIGPFAELLSKKGIKIHVYDHHPFNKGDIRGEVEKIENVGATATIFTEMLKSRKVHPTPMEATILALGIYEETGYLLFPSTTERDLLAVSYLLRRGANLNIVSRFLKMELSMEELDILNELVQSSKEMVIGGIRIKVTKAFREGYLGDAAYLAHRMMDIEDIDAVVVLLGMEGKILMVARSRVPELDVSNVMKEFGGGGHPTAASATIKEASIEILEDKLTEVIRNNVKPFKVASDVMTRPVISIKWDSSIKEAEAMMTRYGVNVLPILREDKYVGLISREIVEKALFHGFGKGKSIDFATTDATTVSLNAPIREIETLMIEQNQRFMPVVDDGRIIGAITRTDLLRTLYEEFLRRRKIEETVVRGKPSAGRSLSSWLKSRFTPEVYNILKFSGEVAEGLGFNAYLVGGSVRDLLRGEENLDIDIVIEGDGIVFAKALGEKLNASVKSHQRFNTAQVITGKLKLDVATARTEYYESPAALPKVETSSIKKDLYRRDFTINTLAIKLNPKDFGLLMDFFGSQRDLKEKTIRVLHNLSFIEDPTRAFRAIRFSERFGFKISKHAENLIKSTVKMNLFEKLSGPRLYEELLLLFNETEPGRALKKLSDLGLLKVIHPALTFNEELEETLKSLHETVSWFNLLFLEEKTDRGVLYLMALLSELKEEEAEAAAERLSPPPKIKDMIDKGISKAKEVVKRLPSEDPVEIYNLLRKLRLETILLAMALSKDRLKQKLISRYLTELRKVEPILKGEDLKKIGVKPGPVYSRILKELLEEKLRGHLKSREDEERFVRRIANKLSEMQSL
ncbi:MAG TPA: CBS domain-containing protein [Thermodesulfovibrionales bacterium]|nr:CBS domain-containing protein [Thermodesulfovibrionales bacterium]